MEGGGEIRRANVVYFLSRGGKVEHPHLIRVHHHLHRAGVRLRDVKRWLSELRGKDMPDSFAWSYKRRYRSGYVWQDLMDDDLITPISDNEYVLKGSELPHRPLHPTATINADDPKDHPFPSFSEKSSRVAAAAAGVEEKEKEEEAETLRIEPDDDEGSGDEASPKPPPPPPPPPPPRDSSDESAARRSAAFEIDACKAAEQAKGEKCDKDAAAAVKRRDGIVGESRGRRRATHVLRNILTCGAVETDDAALRPVGRPESRNAGGAGGGSQLAAARRRASSEGRQDSRKSRSGGGKATKMAGAKVGVASTAGYKPFGAPYCSQCGKLFDPEKLHSHMKSCKALKARGKSYTNL